MSKDIPSEGKAKVLLFWRDFFAFWDCCIINEAWKGNVDSYLAGVIRGVARFISVYEGEYSRERLVQQLARTHPKTITQLAQKDTGSSANRHMRQILRIYNGASREMSLPLKN